MDLGLSGKRALVTGGSVGIGLAIARALAAEGTELALVARTPEPLEGAAETVAAGSGARVVAIPADVADEESVATMARGAVEQLGGVDILVNCAGRREVGPPSDHDLEEDVRLKVRGYLLCARAIAPGMVERGWGRIINIGGDASRQTGSLVRTVRNVAVTAVSKNLADELGPKGVNVTSVHPGMTNTETMPETLEQIARGRGVSRAELEATLAARVSIGRLATGDEVASVVTFLASPRSVALNGDPIFASGGTAGAIHY